MYGSGSTEYTEDINNNAFFKVLKRSKLYGLVERNCWLVCIPQTPSITGLKITQDILDVHVLQPSPYFQGQYITANNKTVTIEDGLISVPNDLRDHRTAKILFEETFYTKDNKSFRVLCIDIPLAGDVKKAQNTVQLPSTRSLKEISEFLHSNPINSIVLAKVQEQIEELKRTYVIVKGFEDHAVRKAQALSEKALEDLVCANPDFRQLYEDDRLTNELSLVVESYVIGKLYPFLYSALKHSFVQEDNKVRDNLFIWRAKNFIQELGLKPNLVQHISDITPHLQRMESCHTPLEKLWCVQEGLDAASFAVSLSRNSETLGADDSLPLLIASVIETAPPNLHTTLFYLQNFIFAKIAASSLGYHLVNLQAAIQFVRGEDDSEHASSVATASRDPMSTQPWQPTHSMADGYQNRQNNRYSTSFLADYRKSGELLDFLTQGVSESPNFNPHRHTSSVKSPRGDGRSPRADDYPNSRNNLINSNSYGSSYQLTDGQRASKSYGAISTPLTVDTYQDWLGAPSPNKPQSSPPLGSRAHSEIDFRNTPLAPSPMTISPYPYSSSSSFSSSSSSSHGYSSSSSNHGSVSSSSSSSFSGSRFDRNSPAFRSTPSFPNTRQYKRAPEVIKVENNATNDEGEGGGFLAQLRKMGDDGVSSSQFRR